MNRDALELASSMRNEVAEVLQWQQAIVARMDQLSPQEDGAASDGLQPEMITQLNEATFRQIMDTSIRRLSKIAN